MENPINDIFQIQENSGVNDDSPRGISSYISCIKINGKPILPPLITDEKRKELKIYKNKAVQIESVISQKKQTNLKFIESNTSLASENSVTDLCPKRQSIPARPLSLQLMPNIPSGTFILSSSSDSKLNKSCSDQEKSIKIDVNSNLNSDSVSSQKSENKNRSKSFTSTLEQRLVVEDVQNKKNLYEQSPIIEENYPLLVAESVDSDDSKKDRSRWSPLNIDSINSLRVDNLSKDSQIGDNSFVSLDDIEKTSDTLTATPNLMRQNSYTLLAPSPALLHYLETQKEAEESRRSHSGRKTWDLKNAKKSWTPASPDHTHKYNNSHNGGVEKVVNKNNSSSLDSYSAFPAVAIRNSSPNEPRPRNCYTDEGSTSPSSYSFKANSPKFHKIKCKIKSRRVKTQKNVPSPKPTDKVPMFGSVQGTETVFVPLRITDELSDLSNLLMKMRMEHERQKKELEEKQRSEMRQLELLFKRRESELLHRQTQDSPPCPRSIYSHCSDPVGNEKFHLQMLGDGSHNSMIENPVTGCKSEHANRPQSAKDYYSPSCGDQESRRTRSMDFNQPNPNQDTDLDVSFHDSLQSREFFVGNEDIIETDTLSNCSSRSSTISSDSKLESVPLLEMRKCKTVEMTPEEFQKYNQAAIVITAAARGFLTRRLLRTAHVQSLITTLRDAISCATQLHGASDLSESDVDLMKRLGRQIEAAWEAVYAVFFDTDVPMKMQFIATDRERLRSLSTKSTPSEPKKRISSATIKSLRRKSGSELLMTRSQMTNGSSSVRKIRSRMIASYPSPEVRYKFK